MKLYIPTWKDSTLMSIGNCMIIKEKHVVPKGWGYYANMLMEKRLQGIKIHLTILTFMDKVNKKCIENFIQNDARRKQASKVKKL